MVDRITPEEERLAAEQKTYEKLDRKFEWKGFEAFLNRHGIAFTATLVISLIWNVINSPFALFILQKTFD